MQISGRAMTPRPHPGVAGPVHASNRRGYTIKSYFSDDMGYICSNHERNLVALPIKFGGLGFLKYCETQNIGSS